MTPYWLMWLTLLAGSLLARPVPREERRLTGGLLLVGLGLLLVIGLRYRVGGDWDNYARILEWVAANSTAEALDYGDIGYTLLNIGAARLGYDLWFVNLVCGLFFMAGLLAMVRRLSNPYLALLVAFPYLILVVAMGYTRQGAAIGCIMLALASYLQRQSLVRYIFWIAVAATFHKTAIIAVPLIAFVGERGRLLNLLLIGSAVVGLYFAFLDESADVLVRNYIEARYASSGALIRIFMCVVPALVFFLFRSRLRFDPFEDRLWRNFSLIAFAAAIALALTPSSTAVDRIALYLLPMQFAILAQVPGTVVERRFGLFAVAGFSGAVLFTWLNYAVHAGGWIPYRFWPLQ